MSRYLTGHLKNQLDNSTEYIVGGWLREKNVFACGHTLGTMCDGHFRMFAERTQWDTTKPKSTTQNCTPSNRLNSICREKLSFFFSQFINKWNIRDKWRKRANFPSVSLQLMRIMRIVNNNFTENENKSIGIWIRLGYAATERGKSISFKIELKPSTEKKG